MNIFRKLLRPVSYGVVSAFLIGTLCSDLHAGLSKGNNAAPNHREIQQWTLKAKRFLKHKRYIEAEPWLRKAAEQGDKIAQAQLGNLYFNGMGVPRNLEEAAYWTRKSAEQGYAIAQTMLGFQYHDGLGLPQDYKQAAHWLQKAADQGLALAQKRIGIMYLHGYGVEKNAGQAVAWFHKAAEQGNVESFYRLGIAYANGNGVTKNDAEATQWIKKAAAKDHREAQILLGWMYHQGLGVSKDYDQALFWLEKVSDENNLLIQISLGVLYFWKRNLELSEKHLRKALAISPKNTNVHANLGFLMFDRQRFDEALKFFDQALKSGSNADTLAGKAITLAALNRAEEALKNYRDAVTLDPRYMDCQKLINENFWSEPACQTARPIIQQIQETATQESSEEN